MSSKLLIVLLFVAGAALSWGVYVPLVHGAAVKLQSNLRAFLFVGVAYFLVAVLVPLFLIFVMKYDPTARAAPNFRAVPIMWASCPAWPALGRFFVIFAATNAGPGGAICAALGLCRRAIVNTSPLSITSTRSKHCPIGSFLRDRLRGDWGGHGDAL